MRTLPIQLDSSPEDAAMLIWWAMVYPNDPTKAWGAHLRESLESKLGTVTARTDGPVTLRTSSLRTLLATDSLASQSRDVDVCKRQGVTAAQVLICLYMAAEIGAPIYLNAAVAILVGADERGRLKQDIAKPYGNRGEILAAWKHMRHVAHFWAALLLTRKASPPTAPLASTRLGDFVATANALLKWGVQARTAYKPTSSTVLDGDHAWRLPNFLPTATLPKFEERQAPDWVLSAIRSKAGR